MDIQRLFADVQRLPSLGPLVQSLMAAFAQPEPDLLNIADQLAQDQGFATKVLRLANSARFAGARQVDSVNDAAILLGLNNLKMLVLCTAMQQRLQHVPHLDTERFWQQNLACAQLSAALARRCRLDPGQAATCGLLHSVGQLFLHQSLPAQAQQVMARSAQGTPRHLVERELLGFDYGDLGAELARRWQFPALIGDVCRHHLDPERAPGPSRALATLVALARHRVMAGPRAPLPEAALAQLGLSAEDLAECDPQPSPV
ncbi:HDOD domain-containing protein [Ferrimonas balearica]|uniref:HDOD domain-containing protein n=1 Tax=Ferrimonas balearica TaxID=44012 RepID=UPI001C998D79|nr:HDOD domain-containing protein [Ferrimonas balearica]MBY5993959.1 HDOD domain-containing protein [Ferrimonas balearica]